MKTILIWICGLLTYYAHGGEIKYPVSEIPATLMQNVNAVVRQDKMICTIKARNKYISYSLFAVTILNAKGKDLASTIASYDKLSNVTEFRATVYDADGKVIKKLKKADIIDRSSYDGFSLFSDNRYKAADLAQETYPYTVEFEKEIEYRFMYFLDGTFIIPDEEISVQYASYQLKYPSGLKPRVKLRNLGEQAPIISKPEPDTESMTWVFQNLTAIKLEPHGPYVRDVLPQIMAAPGEFEFSGYVGNMSSWEEFGKWNQALNTGRDQLPEETKRKVKELTTGLKSDNEKAKVLYEYMQGKTRYVSVQLGIGGFQPFEASVVDKVGYGDCKALSNYLVALLKEAGVKAYYTVIKASEGAKIVEDFPSSQFNHAIVMLPIDEDTIWLECTSQTLPFAYQGKFTGNRKAFVITEHGGKLVNTTNYTAESNVQRRTADVFLNLKGSGTAKVTTTYSGEQYENDNLDAILDNQYDQQQKWVLRNTDIPSFDLNSFSMVEKKNRIPSAIVKLDLTVNRLANVTGKRLFLTPNLMNRSNFLPEKMESRKGKIVLKGISYTDLDTIRYHTPEEIYPEFLPTPITLKSRFGEYQASFKIDQGSVLYIRKMLVRKGEFPAESYQEMIDFFKAINKADNMKLVFMNKT